MNWAMAIDGRDVRNSSSTSGSPDVLASWTGLSSRQHVLILTTDPGGSGAAFTLDRADVIVGTGQRFVRSIALFLILAASFAILAARMCLLPMWILKTLLLLIRLVSGMITEDILTLSFHPELTTTISPAQTPQVTRRALSSMVCHLPIVVIKW